MSRRSLVLATLCVLALGACTAQGQGTVSVTPTSKPVTAAPAVPTGTGRLVALEVHAPASLVAAGGGNVVNGDVTGLVAAGGGNLVAAGGGNIVAAGGLNFRVLATATDAFKPVEQAVVMFKALTAEGQLVDKTAGVTDANGKVTFSGVADQPLVATATFKVDGKVYELGAAIAPGEQQGATFIDPINTFVAARIRTILIENKRDKADVAVADLKMVWGHFNDAGITPDVSALVQGTTLADLNKFYTDNIGKLPPAGQDAVKAYMKKIAEAGQS